MDKRTNKTAETGLMHTKEGTVFDRTEYLQRHDENSPELMVLNHIKDLLIENNRLLKKILK